MKSFAREAKDTGKWAMTAARIVPVGGVKPEEAEETEETDNSLDVRLDKAMAEPDHEREETFRYLKEFRRQKRRGQRLQRQEQAREDMSAEMDRVFREDKERCQTASGEAVAETLGVGIEYVEDETGKLAKKRTTVLRRSTTRRKARRTAADGMHEGVYVKDDDVVSYVPPPPRRFTAEDRKRANKNRVRYTRASWLKRLRAIAEGKETATEQQYQAHIAYGRSKGWLRPASKR